MTMQAALEGYRVLDMTHVLAGPFCCYQLAVLGAEVIKIEPPARPDMMRAEGPIDELACQGMGIHYQSQNAGKLSLTLNLQSAAGTEAFERLVATADVVVTNYRRQSQLALGIDQASLTRINPSVITCSITGFGQTGPKADDPAYDNVIQAFSGLMAATGHQDSGALKVGPPVLDYGTGGQAALAVTAALLQRERTGETTHLDVAMYDAALMLMTSSVTETALTGKPPGRHGNDSPLKAGYGSYQTGNGTLMVGAFTAKQNAELWLALGEKERAAEVQDLSPQEMDARCRSDREVMQQVFATRTALEWEELLNQAGVPAASVRTLDEALAHPQTASRSVVSAIRSSGCAPESRNGETAQSPAAFTTTAWESSGPLCAPASPPPVTGQDTDRLLGDLGYSAEQIHAMHEAGVV